MSRRSTRPGHGSLAFLDNPKYVDDLAATHATACLVKPRYAARVPPATLALVTAEACARFARVLAQLYPDALLPGAVFDSTGESPGADIHPEARLEPDVIVDPGAVIGPYAEIGSGTLVGANAVIGPDVRIGRDCAIGPNASIANALIGDRVIIHTGVRIGQDGFGYIAGPSGHIKVPQIGRVIIQDDVEIGANTTIDRGSTRDTVIGEGTKIDNLVQIGHNVHIGRHCLIVAQVGISGATELGDFVGVGGQAGFTSHLEIGTGAQIAAQSGVIDDLPAEGLGRRHAGAGLPGLAARRSLARSGRRRRQRDAANEISAVQLRQPMDEKVARR